MSRRGKEGRGCMWIGSVGRLIARIRYGRSRGATLVEAAIAVVILGLIAMSITPVMALAVDSQFRQNELKIAENITRAEFEYVRAQDYIWGNGTEVDPETGLHKRVVYEDVYLSEALSSYGFVVLADPIDPGNSTITLPPGEDMGVQRITVRAYGYRYSESGDFKEILETVKYKVSEKDINGNSLWEIYGYELSE